jgi:hypothetical protein
VCLHQLAVAYPQTDAYGIGCVAKIMFRYATTGFNSQRDDIWLWPGDAGTAFNGRLPYNGVPAHSQLLVELLLTPGVASSQPAHASQLQQEEQVQRGGQAPLLRLTTPKALEVLEHVYDYAPAEVGPACHLCLLPDAWQIDQARASPAGYRSRALL